MGPRNKCKLTWIPPAPNPQILGLWACLCRIEDRGIKAHFQAINEKFMEKSNMETFNA